MMNNKIIYQDSTSYIEYDPLARYISVSRGQAHKYRLAAIIFDVPPEYVTYDSLRDIAIKQSIGWTWTKDF